MGGTKLNSPIVQNLLASAIVGLGPGIYVAITILGAGGGPADAARMANIVNSTLYAVYFVSGFFSGSIITTIGPRYTFMLGTLGYPVYVGGLWYFTSTGKLWYPILGGAFLGLTAALLWTASGFIAFSYAAENRKGYYLSMQWGLLSAGSTVASLVAFAINYKATTAQVPLSIYVIFICLMAAAFPTALFGILPPKDIRRADGSAIAHYRHKGFWVELKAQRQLLRDWRMLVLFIPMFGSEVPIIIYSTLNALYFNLRTRSLNSVMFTLMQSVGAVFITFLLDYEKLGGRRRRGMISIFVMGTIITAGWIGLFIWLHNHPFDALAPPEWDWTSSEFGGFFALNLIGGVTMVIYQVVVQWVVASLTNDPEKLARYAGFAKGCLAGGLAASFGVEAAGLSQINVVGFNFALQGAGLVCIFLVCWVCVKPTNYGLEDGMVTPLEVEVTSEKGLQDESHQSDEIELHKRN